MPARGIPTFTHKNSLDRGLVGHWKFNDVIGGTTILDHSGNANDGSIVGDTEQGLVGYFGKSVYFQGTNDYVSIPTNSDLEITGDITLAAWVWTEVTAGDRVIFSKAAAGGSTIPAPYLLYLTRGKIRFGRGNGTVGVLQNSVGTIPSGSWNHIAVSMTGTAARYFINGVFDSQNSITTTTTDAGQEVRLGIAHDNGRDYNGMMDDVRIYNRGLSDSEIALMYSIKRNNAGYAGQWALGEASGTAADTGGFNNNGTIVGATQYYTGFYQNYRALNFDNTDDYVSVPHNSETLGITKDIAIAAFIKVTDLADRQTILAKSSSTGAIPAPYLFRVEPTTGTLKFEVGNGTTSEGVTSTDAIVAGEWYHVAVSKSGNNVSFYIDGVADSGNPHALAGSVSIEDAGEQLTIGSLSSLENDFNGQIQGVKLFNRSLTATDVEFFHNEVDGVGYYDQLEIWYKLDETSGTTLQDFSVNKNDLTFTTGTTVNQTGQINGGVLLGGDASPSDASNTSPTGIPTIADGNFTIMAWVNTNYTTDRQCIISLNNENNLSLYVDGSADTIVISIRATDQVSSAWGGGTICDGTWHHIAVVREGIGTNDIRFYVDGAFIGAVTETGLTSIQAVTAIYLGSDNAGDQEYFDGTLDDIRFYSDDLSDGDIKKIYEDGTG